MGVFISRFLTSFRLITAIVAPWRYPISLNLESPNPSDSSDSDSSYWSLIRVSLLTYTTDTRFFMSDSSMKSISLARLGFKSSLSKFSLTMFLFVV